MADTGETTADVATLSFEAALEQLGRIVRQLEDGQVALDDAITLFERANALKAHCDARLAAAEARIESIRTNAGGEATGTEPFHAG